MKNRVINYRTKITIEHFLLEKEILHSCGIHLIEVKVQKKIIIVTIALSRPGILIGRQGSTIDALTSKIKDRCNKDVKINIKEFDPFMLDYPKPNKIQILVSKIKVFFAKKRAAIAKSISK